MRRHELDRHLGALASLGDPLRRDLYRCVTARDEGVGRDEAAAEVGVSRALAAYHLDKLVEAGLLDTRYERRSGRRGPGAGRTAKLYLRSATPVEVALPARDYQLMAELLARAVEADPSGAAGSALGQEAHALGAEVARREAAGRTAGQDTAGRAAERDTGQDDRAAAVRALLAERGYEPYQDGAATRLRNCPFGRLAQAHRDLVCSANLAFVQGLLEGQRCGLRAVLEPRPGRCCVALV